MTSIRLAMLAALGALALSSGCGDQGPKEIQFMQYGEGYAAKPDFALVEHKYPLSPKLRSELNPKYLAGLDQEQVDQIYARLTAGPIPDGAFEGNLFFPKGMSGERRVAGGANASDVKSSRAQVSDGPVGVAAIPGAVPPLDALPPGCAFAPRCASRQDECSVAVPDWREAGPDHRARCVLVGGDGRA